jgi:hypothetical protein
MAVKKFRFKKTDGIILDQLLSQLPTTATIDDDAGGNIVTISHEESTEADLVDAMAELGYTLIEGTGGVGVTGVASDDEDRRLLSSKNPVRVCTGGVDISATWTPSGSGRGKTLTSPNVNLSHNDFDGVTIVVGDRVLVKDGAGAAAVHNGIYELIQAADGAGDLAILRRARDYDDDVEVLPGSTTLVLEGTTCSKRAFLMSTAGPITVDTSQLVFEQPAAASAASDTLQWGAGTLGNSPTPRYLYPTYSDAQAQAAVIQIRAPRSGTLQNLRVRHNDIGGSAIVVTYTLRVNNSPTSLVVALAANVLDGSDLVNSVVISAGDLLDIEVTKAGTLTGSSLRDIVATMEFTN